MTKLFTTITKGITAIPYEVRVPSGDFSSYFGDIITEPQKFGLWDTDDCWDASAYKGGIEIQCNYLLSIGAFSPAALAFFKNPIPSKPQISYLDTGGFMKTSERYSEILSGNFDNGGTGIEAGDLFQEYGCIPWSMLNYTDAQAYQWQTKAQFNEDYFNPAEVTDEMKALGKQFLQYVSITFQRIGTLGITPNTLILQAAYKQAPLQFGIAVDQNWNQVNVPVPNNNIMAHEVTGYRMNADGSNGIIDNYPPFIKNLAINYPLLAVLQIVVTPVAPAAINPAPQPTAPFSDSFWSSVYQWFRTNVFNPQMPVGKE